MVLGIFDGHNSGACLLKNGKIITALSQERLTRKKNDSGYPKESIDQILEISEINANDLDIVCFAGKTIQTKEFYMSERTWYKTLPPTTSDSLKDKLSILEKNNDKRKHNVIEHLKIPESKIKIIDHHLAHASTAYHGSSWVNDEKILIFTCDGGGDGISATVSVGQFGSITELSKTDSTNSLGKIFSRVTYLMGMNPNEHEYKIMGMAPYADHKGLQKSYSVFSQLLEVKNDDLNFSKKQFSTHYCYNFLKENLENHRFDWISGGIQQFTEDLLLKWIKNAIQKTGIRKIVCAGGTFMNVKANMRIKNLPEVDDVFVFPSCGDESLPFGAAYYAYVELLQSTNSKISIPPLGPIYLGSEFTNDEILKSIKENLEVSDYSIEQIDDISSRVGELIYKNNVVARFNGKMEFGARSLGNRSILANPQNFDTVRKINTAIKQRDFWMPFAPSLLHEKQNEIILNEKKISSPYMVIGFETQESIQKNIPAVIHPYDFSARPQILEESFNPEYHALISKFYELSGIPVVLNTSFNLHGFPIVCSPKDALLTFKNSGLEFLAIENYLIQKK